MEKTTHLGSFFNTTGRNTSTDVEKTGGVLGSVAGGGNTSTDVEKTHHQYPDNRSLWKHLHGRGEDLTNQEAPIPGRETPPRTWRRREFASKIEPTIGNTSTDVEKTDGYCYFERAEWKHLHGRGEDLGGIPSSLSRLETPPRTWRRPFLFGAFGNSFGNTSTDVEKTARFSIRLIQPTLLFVVVVVKGGSLTN